MPTYYQSPTGNLREDFYQRQGYYPTPAPTMREGVENMGRDALLAGLNAGKLAGEALIPQSPTDLGIMFASSALGPAGLLGRGMRAAGGGLLMALDPSEAEAGPLKLLSKVAKPIRAYHGSPHDFDAFDLGKIGTGEGAQAYGHGLYFAENEGVARSYRDLLANQLAVGGTQVPLSWKNSGKPAHLLVAHNMDFDAAIRAAQDGIDRNSPRTVDEFRDAFKTLNEWKASATTPEVVNTGRMYEVNIHADPQRFLDWDKPLSRQSPDVQGVLERFGFKAEPEKMAAYDDALLAALRADGPSPPLPKQPADPLGANIYESQKLVPGAYRDSAQATGALRDAGIPGIKYLDQGSRSAGEGTSNYVVFDPSIIEIIKKYGLLAPMAGSAMSGGLLDYQPAAP
jgi:hypothetical protein